MVGSRARLDPFFLPEKVPTLVKVATHDSSVRETVAAIPLFVILVIPFCVVPTHGMRTLAALAHRASDIHGALNALLSRLDRELHFPARLAVDFGAPERVVQNPREILVARDAHVGFFAVEVARECGLFISFVFECQVSSLQVPYPTLPGPFSCTRSDSQLRVLSPRQ